MIECHVSKGAKAMQRAIGQMAGTISSPDLLEHFALFDTIAQEAPSYSEEETKTLIFLVELLVEKNYQLSIIKKIIECKKEAFINQKDIWLWACSFCSLETMKYIETSGLPIDYSRGALNCILNHQHHAFIYLLSTKQLTLTEGLLCQAIVRHLSPHTRPNFTTINSMVEKLEEINDLSDYSFKTLQRVKKEYNQSFTVKAKTLEQLETIEKLIEKALLLKGINGVKPQAATKSSVLLGGIDGIENKKELLKSVSSKPANKI